jgi:3-oxoacyl-[acyl-carrier-protein] synthase II
MLWNKILAGDSGIHPLTIRPTENHKVRFGGDIPDFDPSGIVDAKEVKRLDRFTLFAMVAAHHAIRDSGISFDREDPYRCGVIIGSGKSKTRWNDFLPRGRIESVRSPSPR